MDKLSVHHSKSSSSKQSSKGKKKPIKVVYISNPMKVKTSPSGFRALVQELTGQDSNLDDVRNLSGVVEEVVLGDAAGGAAQENRKVDPYCEAIRSLDSSYGELEMFDDQGFGSCVFENFNGFSGLYDFSKAAVEKP